MSQLELCECCGHSGSHWSTKWEQWLCRVCEADYNQEEREDVENPESES